MREWARLLLTRTHAYTQLLTGRAHCQEHAFACCLIIIEIQIANFLDCDIFFFSFQQKIVGYFGVSNQKIGITVWSATMSKNTYKANWKQLECRDSCIDYYHRKTTTASRKEEEEEEKWCRIQRGTQKKSRQIPFLGSVKIHANTKGRISYFFFLLFLQQISPTERMESSKLTF